MTDDDRKPVVNTSIDELLAALKNKHPEFIKEKGEK